MKRFANVCNPREIFNNGDLQVIVLRLFAMPICEQMIVRISLTPDMQLLKTVPGVGDILAIVIGTEIGLIERFASAEQLASYAGTVPAMKSSGGKIRYGHTPKKSNHYLKWAFVEATNGPLSIARSLAGSTGMSPTYMSG